MLPYFGFISEYSDDNIDVIKIAVFDHPTIVGCPVCLQIIPSSIHIPVNVLSPKITVHRLHIAVDSSTRVYFHLAMYGKIHA